MTPAESCLRSDQYTTSCDVIRLIPDMRLSNARDLRGHRDDAIHDIIDTTLANFNVLDDVVTKCHYN